MRASDVRRRVVIAVLCAAPVLAACGLGGGDPPADSASPPAVVAVFPSPGTHTAASGTQVSVRGIAPGRLRGLVVRGSRTGRHGGRLVRHADGRGASFVPEQPFAPGERVSVRLPVRVAGAGGPVDTFVVARSSTPAPAAQAVQGTSRSRGAARFRSRPDLRPPVIDVRRSRAPAAGGDFFVAPKAGSTQAGPMIVDRAGRLVWFHPVAKGLQAYDFRTQTYRGRPVLTWWQGRFLGAFGAGEGVIYDSALRRIARVRAGNGYQSDLHEFELTPRDTALLTIYNRVQTSLSSIGGPARGTVLEGVVQEVDVATGAVLFEWHSLRDVALSESYMEVPRSTRGKPYDYFHVNSVELDTDGNLLISGRHTHAVYKVDRQTGRIIWRLGGKRSDFDMGPGTRFRWQHDARRRADGALTVFDNRARQPAPVIRSRALAIRVDEAARTATLLSEIRHPGRVLAASQGNAQTLPDGSVVIGWGGRNPLFSQFDAVGRLLFDARFRDPHAESYRAYRLPWSARPASRPALVARARGAGMVVYASWNGATAVAAWRVVAPRGRAAPPVLARAPRAGFETAIRVARRTPRVIVQALDAGGRVLATSRPVAMSAGAG
jgi:Arylsulfotransferase (ASST)